MLFSAATILLLTYGVGNNRVEEGAHIEVKHPEVKYPGVGKRLPQAPRVASWLSYDSCPTLPTIFSAILLLGSNFDVRPMLLMNLMAISCGNSLYIDSALLQDPGHLSNAPEVWHVVGNVGRPGVALLVPPVTPRAIPRDIGDWSVIREEDWDGRQRNSFASSSLHLSFTGALQDVDTGYDGGHDKEVYKLESIVSLYAEQRWIADLDIGTLFRLYRPPYPRNYHWSGKGTENEMISIISSLKGSMTGVSQRRSCSEHENECARATLGTMSFVALENWPEFLEFPSRRSVFLAYGNWQARLAAVLIAISQQAKVLVIDGDSPCWTCLRQSEDRLGEEVIYIY